MSRRRVRLGSGLDPLKLAGAIRQIAITDTPPPALACHAPGQEDSWMHLMALVEKPEKDAPTTITGWKLTFGYAFENELGDLPGRSRIVLPAGATIDAWEAGIYASIHIPHDASPDTIANLMLDIAYHLQDIDEPQDVELELEYFER
ncbi:MAG: hypothetical protein JXB07_12690 [Anaerolineae bacterium]|nr:hypothetical protein [Anaerolineae bacterium]